LLAITKSIESAMKAGQSAAIRRAWADFLAATSDFYELPALQADANWYG